MDKCQEYIRDIFGEPHESTALPMFGTYYNNGRPFAELSEEQCRDRLVALGELFETYQQFIKNKVFNRTNFLSQLNDTWLSALLFFFASTIFSAGFIAGNYSDSSREMQELIDENKKLKEELSTVMIFNFSDKVVNVNA